MSHVKLYVLNNEAESERQQTPESGQAVRLACPVTLQQFSGGSLSFQEGLVAVESDIRIVVNGRDFGALTRTPGDDLSLIAGYLFTHSMIREGDDMVDCSFRYRSTSHATVTLKTAECIRRLYPSPKPVHVVPERVFAFKRSFERRQNLYKNTRSTHGAALFSLEGELLAFGEDVGRHNAFDKAIGRALLEGTLDRVNIAMLSSRLALELTKKAATANIPILCGFSAATSSSINYAERNNITLVGRIRSDSFDVYSNGWRFQ
ncbi:sufurtransferase FdhD [Pseudodesulfovibrio sp. JC047]|uniref:formate dehydrogenase accessory sulfurtransferase FdhD n=1 Tax=Pseudodesulfovibrio sp. JC047 TaxID=2683199 RepID=UPI0013D040D9|nr:formate dehydrogenase accessory sulfurtransferase FdhD [Pseudodesulfovibrio sp. JC047]NDV18571.1 sufurtransferase FdhD [Pseudodesulfovibrio sp. JC047]